MNLYHSPTSPFVRKVMVCAHELGIQGQIEQIPSAPHPVDRDETVIAANPLGQVPTLITDEGSAIADSRVICEYLDDLANGDLFGTGPVRWRNLTESAYCDGLLGAALLIRYEAAARPAELRWKAWAEGKVSDVLARSEQRASRLAERVDIETITLACGLGYLDFRFPDVDWRIVHPDLARWFASFAARPSMLVTAPA